MSNTFISKARDVLLYEAYDSNPNASSLQDLKFIDMFGDFRSSIVYYIAEQPRLRRQSAYRVLSWSRA